MNNQLYSRLLSEYQDHEFNELDLEKFQAMFVRPECSFKSFLASSRSQQDLKHVASSQDLISSSSKLEKTQSAPPLDEGEAGGENGILGGEEGEVAPQLPQIKNGIDLLTAIEDFVSSLTQTVAVVFSPPGYGKTWLLKKIEMLYWEKLQAHSEENPTIPLFNQKKRTPIYVQLSRLKNPYSDCMNEALKRKGLTEDEIHHLKKEPILLILDGYEEIRATENLYESNRLYNWKDLKVIISCRSGYFSEDLYVQRFGSKASSGRAHLHSLVQFHINPFNADKIQQLIRNFCSSTWNTSNLGFQEISRMVQALPGFELLAGCPLNVRLVLTVIDRIFEQKKVDHSRALTISDIYQGYLEHWFDQAVTRVIASNGTEKQDHKTNGNGSAQPASNSSAELDTQIKAAPPIQMDAKSLKEAMQKFANELGIWMFLEDKGLLRNSDHLFKYFFERLEDPIMIMGREGAPIYRFSDCFTFFHRSYREYLAAQFLFHELMNFHAITKYQAIDNSFDFNRKVLNREPMLVQFLADKITVPGFQDKLFRIVEDSKVDSGVSVAASNAISILNRAGVSFVNLDWRGVNIIGADFTCGRLENVDLRFANLSHASFIGATLRSVKLDYAIMRDVLLTTKTTSNPVAAVFNNSVIQLLNFLNIGHADKVKAYEIHPNISVDQPVKLVMEKCSWNGAIGLTDEDKERLINKNGGPSPTDFQVPKELFEILHLSVPFILDHQFEGFRIQTALSLVQLCVLTYEDLQKVNFVAQEIWGFGRPRVISSEREKIRCIVESKEAQLIFAFRGTDNMHNFMVDLDTAKSVSKLCNGQVHRGFYEALQSVWEQIKLEMDDHRRALAKNEPGTDPVFWFTGHSLGGALATLAVARAIDEGMAKPEQVRHYVVGHPRCGDATFAEEFVKLVPLSFPVVQKGDPFTRVPPHSWPFCYRHLNNFRYLDQNGYIRMDRHALESDLRKDLVAKQLEKRNRPYQTRLDVNLADVEGELKSLEDEKQIYNELESEVGIPHSLSIGGHSCVTYLNSLKLLLERQVDTNKRLTKPAPKHVKTVAEE